jgi:hypothetical protein
MGAAPWFQCHGFSFFVDRKDGYLELWTPRPGKRRVFFKAVRKKADKRFKAKKSAEKGKLSERTRRKITDLQPEKAMVAGLPKWTPRNLLLLQDTKPESLPLVTRWAYRGDRQRLSPQGGEDPEAVRNCTRVSGKA